MKYFLPRTQNAPRVSTEMNGIQREARYPNAPGVSPWVRGLLAIVLTFLLVPAAITTAQTGSACPENTVCLDDPLNLQGDPFKLYGRLIGAFVGIAGSTALFFFIWGGFQWLTSGGNEEKIKKGKETILWATLGLTAILGAYFFLSYIIDVILGATTTK